ncbi:MAG TPA: hypothetical protein VF843_07350 [Streptosporangiaceae bacterium]
MTVPWFGQPDPEVWRDLLADLPGDTGERPADILAGLFPLLPDELLGRATAASTGLPDEDRAVALEALIPRLADSGDPGLLQRALRGGRAIGTEYYKSRTLSAVAPQVPADLKAELTEAAHELGEDFWRAKILVRTTDDAPLAGADHPGVAPEAWQAWARTAGHQEPDDPGGPDPGSAAPAGRRSGTFSRLRALLGVAVRSVADRPAAIEAALRLAMSFRDPLTRTLALAAIGAVQPGPDLERAALTAASDIADPAGRAAGLARVAAIAEPSRRADLAEQAATAASQVDDPAVRSLAYLQLVPAVTGPMQAALRGEALTWAREIADPAQRSLRLGDVARLETGELRIRVLTEALETARAIPRPADRALPLARITPHVPDSERPDALAAALADARALPDLHHRTNVLTVLAGNLAEQESQSLRQRDDLTARLRQTISQLGPQPARDLMSASLGPSISLKDIAALPSLGLTEEILVAGPPAGPPAAEPGERADRRRRPAGRKRTVSTGFASVAAPGTPIPRSMPLASGADCYFWFQIGRPVRGAIDVRPGQLPAWVPRGATLQVALFGYADELAVRPDAAVGELALQADGTAVVLRQPGAGPAATPAVSSRSRKRLFFPVRAPVAGDTARLRCNVYHEGLLVQSILVSARIMREPVRTPGALSAKTDYVLSQTLGAEQLTSLRSHRLSIMLNDNGHGDVGVRVLGADGSQVYRRDAAVSESTMNAQRDDARGALRTASWSEDSEWTPASAYRYADGARDLDRLHQDLITLASAGSRLLLGLTAALGASEGRTAYEELDALMPLVRTPSYVQLALKESASSVFPVEMLYDYRLDDGAPDLRLCREFTEAFASKVPMAEVACFAGNCPQARPGADPAVICPSGFWGFRHYLGVPFSLGGARDLPGRLDCAGEPQIGVGVFRDFKLVGRHWHKLQELAPAARWEYADTREGTVRFMRDNQPQVVYLYCHGGRQKTIPYIRVESSSVYPITPNTLFQERVSWPRSRPLVFLNGCETSGLQPEEAIRFVDFFVSTASASGVIGTQITVFEQLACDFAEECLRQFLVEGVSIGEAVRAARLKLLGLGNPLGLVYIPFAMAGLQLARRPAVPDLAPAS